MHDDAPGIDEETGHALDAELRRHQARLLNIVPFGSDYREECKRYNDRVDHLFKLAAEKARLRGG